MCLYMESLEDRYLVDDAGVAHGARRAPRLALVVEGVRLCVCVCVHSCGVVESGHAVISLGRSVDTDRSIDRWPYLVVAGRDLLVAGVVRRERAELIQVLLG